VTPKGPRPVARDGAHDVASCPADAQEQCSNTGRRAAGIVLPCRDTAGQDRAAEEVRDSINPVWGKSPIGAGRWRLLNKETGTARDYWLRISRTLSASSAAVYGFFNHAPAQGPGARPLAQHSRT
jgi:hypothetical protein